jgi:hypothetical protein
VCRNRHRDAEVRRCPLCSLAVVMALAVSERDGMAPPECQDKEFL